ncbi:uncharacterized protein METZ01_LOCUS379130 [marine metagenome]|uniref:Uncharacterized protein n=1 Tax=marine metagenome TaxID=408172 RepID=A0A382TW40_9ZZZZ
MKKWYEILWGSREEEDIERRVHEVEQKLHGMGDITDEPSYQKDVDPDEITIDNAYKTRWIWYHTILGILMLIINILLVAILTLLAIKL